MSRRRSQSASLSASLLASLWLMAPSVVHAEGAEDPLTVDGSFWSRFELREGYSNAGVSRGRFQEGDATFYRARLGLWTQPRAFRQNHSVRARLSIQAAGVQGTMPGTINDAPLGAHEAFLRWQSPIHRLDAGRFELAYGDHLVVGNLGWHQVARSWDGLRVRFGDQKAKGAWLDVFATRQRPDAVPAERHPAHDGFLEGDDWFTGLYSDIGPWLGEGLTLELYSLFQIQREHDAVGDTDARGDAMLITAGTRVAKSFGKTRVRFEGTGQTGKDLQERDVAAYQADLEVKHTFSERFFVAVGGLYASGDDPDTDENEGFNHLYSTAHKFLGLMDVIGTRNNVTSGLIKTAWKVQPTTTLKLDAHTFLRNETRDDVDSYAGSEFDLQVVQVIGGGLGVRGLYGVFLPGSGALDSDDPIHYLAVQFGFNFK